MKRWVPQRFIEARERAGIEKARLARMLGVAKSAISAWERGKYGPSGANLVALAAILHVSPDALYEDDGEATPVIMEQRERQDDAKPRKWSRAELRQEIRAILEEMRSEPLFGHRKRR